jgi:hypothetical protein
MFCGKILSFHIHSDNIHFVGQFEDNLGDCKMLIYQHNSGVNIVIAKTNIVHCTPCFLKKPEHISNPTAV